LNEKYGEGCRGMELLESAEKMVSHTAYLSLNYAGFYNDSFRRFGGGSFYLCNILSI